MSKVQTVAQQMTRASQKFFYDPSTVLEFPEELDADAWAMSPELVSLYDTPIWHEMSEEEQAAAFEE